jgi:hypothetical protein
VIPVHLGTFFTSGNRTKVRFQFSTHAAAGGNVAPNSAFEAADLRIYKALDSAAFSATQRSSAAGITMTSPFDTLTGVHDVVIDLTENTDAGFYVPGFYSVMLAPDETVDGQTITGVVLAYFEIGYRTELVALATSGGSTSTTILNATTGINGGAPSSTNNFYRNLMLIASTGQRAPITGYDQATQTLYHPPLATAIANGETFLLA